MQSTSHTTKKAIKRLKLDPTHPSLTERGLTPETIQTFGLGFCSTGAMAGRIVIPIHNHGGYLIAYAGESPQGGMRKFKLSAGFDPSLELFNLNRAALESPDKILIVVEGFFDAIKLHQLGHHKVVALMGNRLSPTQENILLQATDQHCRILLMLNETEESRTARVEMAARLARLAFVRIHSFDQLGWCPEQLTEDELEEVFL